MTSGLIFCCSKSFKNAISSVIIAFASSLVLLKVNNSSINSSTSTPNNKRFLT